MGAAGQGSISFSPKEPTIPAPGPPFTANSADNGLSVDPITGRIVLGNNAGDITAALLSNREIPLDGFNFKIEDPLSGHQFQIGGLPGATNNFTSGDGLGNDATINLTGDGLTNNFELFSNTPLGTQARIIGSPITERIQASLNSNDVIDLNKSLDQYSFGDLAAIVNGNMLFIDDLNQSINLMDALGIMLSLARGSGLYQMGDISAVGNQLHFELDDNTPVATIITALGRMLSLNQSTGLYDIGDIDNTLNGNRINIDDTNSVFEFLNPLATALRLDLQIFSFIMGDISAAQNGTVIDVDDTANAIAIYNNANTAIVNINGVAGFTGTVTPVNSITVDGGIVTAVT